MAIKVVQGLIDVRASDSAIGLSRVSRASDDLSKTLSRTQQIVSSQQLLTVATSASQIKASGDAALSVVRARASGKEGSSLRDAKEAQSVANTVAARVGNRGDNGTQAHSSLSAASARQHF